MNRAGQHQGLFAMACGKCAPSIAKRSRLGVQTLGSPAMPGFGRDADRQKSIKYLVGFPYMPLLVLLLLLLVLLPGSLSQTAKQTPVAKCPGASESPGASSPKLNQYCDATLNAARHV